MLAQAQTTIQLIAPNAPTITINTNYTCNMYRAVMDSLLQSLQVVHRAYVYSISGGTPIDALGNATNLCAGTVVYYYCDRCQCLHRHNNFIQLTAPNAPTIMINTTTAPTCLPGCDGTATTITVGGTPAYVYSISGGATIDVLGNASNLCAGITYTITVTDANRCTGTYQYQFINPECTDFSVSNITNASCNGLATVLRKQEQ
ncbi:MAG: SprB repeat-containing protein [Bacteroidetes bacterium]|nr:SprB repeat-containing protein [Bacteroidota bacterium]